MIEIVEDLETVAEIDADISIDKIDALNSHAWEIRRSDLKTSWKNASETERISFLKSYDKGLAESMRTLSYCSLRFGDYAISLEKSMIAVDLFRQLNNKKGEADVLNIIGAILFSYNGNNESRLKYNQRCLQLCIDINDTEGIAESENHIGETYLDIGDFDQADKWVSKCLNNPNSTVPSLAWANHNQGLISFRKKQFEEAIYSFYKSVHLSDSVKYGLLSVSTHLYIAKALIELGVTSNQVDFHLNIALDTSFKSGIKEERNKIYLAFSEMEEKRGNIDIAYKWFKKHYASYNALFKEENVRKINNIAYLL